MATLASARRVEERGRFLVNELLGRRMTRSYHLRESGLTAVVRHPLTDIHIFREVFVLREYEMPELVREKLGREVRVVELGAHVGLFAVYAFGVLPKARIVSFEPDQRNLAVLRRCMSENDLDWELVPAAAGTRDGRAAFISEFSLSQLATIGGPRARWDTFIPARSIPDHMRPTDVFVPVVDVFPYFDCDLIKLDVEGAEWELLADPRFADTTAKALVLEVHPEMCPADPVACLREGLDNSGFDLLPSQGAGGLTEVLWAVRRTS